MHLNRKGPGCCRQGASVAYTLSEMGPVRGEARQYSLLHLDGNRAQLLHTGGFSCLLGSARH